MEKINEIKARQIFDTRGNPTLEVEVISTSFYCAKTSVPSNLLIGPYEAIELRDHNSKVNNGLSVYKAIDIIKNKITPMLLYQKVINQKEIDDLLIQLDGTQNKAKLGSNTLLACSLSIAYLASKCSNLPLYQYLGGTRAKYLPTPVISMYQGGRCLSSTVTFQDFMIIPLGASSMSLALQMAQEINVCFHRILKQAVQRIEMDNEEILDILLKAINLAGYSYPKDVMLGIHVGASDFYEEQMYTVKNQKQTPTQLIDYYLELSNKYPIFMMEDAMSYDDIHGWKELSKRMNDKALLIGNEMFAGDKQRLLEGVRDDIAGGINIIPSSVGCLSQTIETIEQANHSHYHVMISNQYNESEDTFIIDLAIAFQVPLLKLGSLTNSGQFHKYNRLLRIEEQLGKDAIYLGRKNFKYY